MPNISNFQGQNLLQPGTLQRPAMQTAMQPGAANVGMMPARSPGAIQGGGAPAPSPGQQGGGGPPAPSPPPQALNMLPPQSVEQQALGGGGNHQQIQNFLQALQQAQAVGGNSFMGTAGPPQPQVANMVNPAAMGGPGAMQQAGGMPNPAMMQTPGMAMQPPRTPMGAMPMQLGMQPPAMGMGGGTGKVAGIDPTMMQQQQAPMQRMMAPGMLMSDEEQKRAVQDANPKLHRFMESIGAWNYEYKDPAQDGRGTFTSPMAQELEKTALGKQAVIDTPRGKMVDYARLGGVNLAGLSVVHREQQKLAAQVAKLRAAVRSK